MTVRASFQFVVVNASVVWSPGLPSVSNASPASSLDTVTVTVPDGRAVSTAVYVSVAAPPSVSERPSAGANARPGASSSSTSTASVGADDTPA